MLESRVGNADFRKCGKYSNENFVVLYRGTHLDGTGNGKTNSGSRTPHLLVANVSTLCTIITHITYHRRSH
jgi:hypothetical protein